MLKKKFQAPHLREVDLTSNAVIKIDQSIHPKIKNPSLPTESLTIDRIDLFTPKKPLFATNSQPFSLPLPTGPLNYKQAQVNINTNITARWQLMYNGEVVHAGTGSTPRLFVPPAHGYYLLAQEIPGYHQYLSPCNPFDLVSGQNLVIDIDYRQEIGFLEVQGKWLESEKKITIKLVPTDQKVPLIKTKLVAISGNIHWQSGPLPVGEYTAFFEIEGKAQEIEKQKFIIRRNQGTTLNFPSKNQSSSNKPTGNLQVTSNTPQSIYTLFDQAGLVYAQGQGDSFLFEHLPQGYYQLNFSSADPRLFVPPTSQMITIHDKKQALSNAIYKKMGRLTVGSNLDAFKVTIQSQENNETNITKQIIGKSQYFYLEEGDYRIIYEPLTFDGPAVKSHKVTIKSTAPQTVYSAYQIDSLSASTRGQFSTASEIIIHTNIVEANYKLQKVEEGIKNKTIGKYRGKECFIPLVKEGNYVISFGSVPNYSTPNPVFFDLKQEKKIEIKVNYHPSASFITIPAGKAIIGDPFFNKVSKTRPAKEVEIAEFKIGQYPVTNEQFANWLTDAFARGEVLWDLHHPGAIVNQEGFLLCHTNKANPLSQIFFINESMHTQFLPITGKENFPVIAVTWHGANHYCKNNQCRLPTENEWEKAAGMSIDLKKRFKYWFGKNEINYRCANYREQEAPVENIQVLTTKVGFYNGKHKLTLGTKEKKVVKTEDAKSPFGLYDISGNVWEWVMSDEENTQLYYKKIAKGGCYDSLEKSVQISERVFLPVDHLDIYTGFRVVQNPSK